MKLEKAKEYETPRFSLAVFEQKDMIVTSGEPFETATPMDVDVSWNKAWN